MSHTLQNTLALAQSRARLWASVRQYFDSHGFVEVDTPVAILAPAPEANIEAPKTTLNGGRRFLQTSPELSMKRLLAAGLTRIYQIAPVFRDGDHSPLHRPEFRLLEWYRRDTSYLSLFSDCENLLRTCATALNAQHIDFSQPFRRISVNQAFIDHAGFAIVEALESSALRKQLDTLGIHHQPDDSWDDLFNRVFLTRVEPELLASPTPLFLTHFPAPMASLAQKCPDDPRVAERFELYVAGMELANGFGELVDPVEQRLRFAEEQTRRQSKKMHDYPLDEAFLTCLGTIRSAAGIALGMDRLLMVLLGKNDINDIALLPWQSV